jgi:hypothetical protein
VKPRDEAMRASQVLADALGEGWTPAPTLAVSGGWHAAAECGRLRVAQWLRDSGEVRYTAAVDAGTPSGATPRDAAPRPEG